jgi:hypothetical protein
MIPSQLRRIAALCAALAALLVVGAGCQGILLFEERLMWGKPPSHDYGPDVHGVKVKWHGESPTLEYRGRSYGAVFSQWYEYVPELDGIIFATRRGSGNIKLHFAPSSGERGMRVDEGENGMFGIALGQGKHNSFSEYVEGVTNRVVTFVAVREKPDESGWHFDRTHYTWDLKNNTFE